MPTFESVRFGTLNYDDTDVLLLPEGLIGLPQLRRWLMLDMEQEVPMRWLQSLDRPDFGLPVMPPLFFADEFEVKTRTMASRLISSDAPPDLVTLIIANIHSGGERITGNLRAPLVIDTVTRRGAQLSLEDDQLSIRQEIDYLKFALALAGDTAENGRVVEEAAAGLSPETEAMPSDADTENQKQTVSSGL
jgi:flagellar assembly factor FliW